MKRRGAPPAAGPGRAYSEVKVATAPAAAQAARTAPAAWLEQRHLYGDLADNPRFADAFSGWLTLMYKAGMSTALHTYLEGS